MIFYFEPGRPPGRANPFFCQLPPQAKEGDRLDYDWAGNLPGGERVEITAPAYSSIAWWSWQSVLTAL